MVKQFNAICPTTRIIVGQAYTQATSLNASDFLDFMVLRFPFKIISIQVDGGSEFRSEFEKACQNLQIRSTLRIINEKLQKIMIFYNFYRPHRGLQCLTPMEYYRSMEAKK